MLDEYGTHAEYMEWVRTDADVRQHNIENTLQKAFGDYIEERNVKAIAFSKVSSDVLAEAIAKHPVILKPLLAACNVAARAIERDLLIKNLDTYGPKLTGAQAKAIAEYIKPFLAAYLEIRTLTQIDRIAFIDKEIRKRKGRWEWKVIDSLNRFGTLRFRKRKFVAEGEQFELDAASPGSGDIRVGVDIKRIEARRDIHKRCDEIINKGGRLKLAFPKARFGVVVYYPFAEEHTKIEDRLRSEYVDSVVFASETEDSINNAAKLLLSAVGLDGESEA